MAKFIVIALMIAILASLFSALTYILRDKGTGERAAKALTVRVSLSLVLFILLLAGFHFGIIPRHGL